MSFNISTPWILCRDFNCVMNTNEWVVSSVRKLEMKDIRECMLYYGMQDMKSTGNFFTWNNKQLESSRVFSKLDRVVVFLAGYIYTSAQVSFQPKGEFDH